MNSNGFVVPPKSKAISIKLNARNPQELQMKMATLAQESIEMEEKLQQLKESMSKEKEERGHSGGFRWKAGQCGSLNSSALMNSSKRTKENTLQKLSTGKVKIRVLKESPLTAPSQAMPPPPPPTIDLQKARRNRLRGTFCGQCEVKTVGVMCAECTEDYCIACFLKLHQKGALKLHRMVPIQPDLQTHVSTRDVVSCFQEQMIPSSSPSTFERQRQRDHSRGKRSEAVAEPMQRYPDPSQVLAVNHGEERNAEMIEQWPKGEDERGFPTSLLWGEYNEEESARSFQEALRQWREEKNDGDGRQMISVAATATQADLAPAEGRGRGNGNFRVEFTANSLTYMDRLLLKKHRRTPIEMYHPSLACGTDSNSPPNTNHEEESAGSLTAQEEDFRRYCASLFAVPVSRGSTEPQITSPEPYLTIEILDERDRDTVGDVFAELRTENNKKVPTVQTDLSKERTTVSQTTLTSSGPPRVSRSSSGPTRSSGEPARSKAVQKLSLSQPQNLQAEHSMKTSSYKTKPSPGPTNKAPRTPKASIETPTSKLQKPNRSPTVHKSRPDCGSSQNLCNPSLLHSQTENPKSSHAPVSFPSDVSHSACVRPPITEEHCASSPSTSFSLRSTFSLSPAGSTESPLLPRVYQSIPFQKRSDSSLLPQQPQFSQLFPQPISSLKHSQSLPRSFDSLGQSQPSLCERDSPTSVNQPQLPLSPVSSSQDPSTKSPPVEILSGSSVFNECPLDQYCRHRSTPTNEEAPDFMFPLQISLDHESTLSPQAALCIPSLPSHLLNAFMNPLAVEIEERDDLSLDSGEEMSSDSLRMTPHEEDSSEDEAQMYRTASRGWSREEERRNPAIHEEREKDSQTDVQEQLSEPSMMMNRQSAGSGSDQSCDLDGFLPPGLRMNSGNIDTPEHTRCDSQHTSQTPTDDSDPTGSEDDRPRGLITTNTEEHLPFTMMIVNHMQLTAIQSQPTTTTRRGETSANEPGTIGCNLSGKSTPTLSEVPAASCLSYPTLGSELLRPFSRAAQEIMEICSVDQIGCEDPDLDTDATTHTLHELERELRLMTTETGKQTSVFGGLSSQSQDLQENHHFKRGKISKELADEEAAAHGDQQSVLLLP